MSDDLILFDFYYAFLTLHALCKQVGCPMYSVVQYKRTIKMTVRGFGGFFSDELHCNLLFHAVLCWNSLRSLVCSIHDEGHIGPSSSTSWFAFSQISAGPRITLSSTLNRSSELCLNCVMTNLSFGSLFSGIKKKKSFKQSSRFWFLVQINGTNIPAHRI